MVRSRADALKPSATESASTDPQKIIADLRRQLDASRAYQTATSEVLQVIGRAAFDLDAVLKTVAEMAVQLCRGEYGVIFRNEDGEYRYAAGYGNRPEYEENERRAVIRPGRGTIIGRAALEGRAVQIADALSDPDYTDKDGARLADAHTMLGVPLLREGQVIGALGLARNRIEPFSAREVELVTTFADQAAIAIENARLLDELRRRQAELRVTFDHMGDGVVMFGADLRLAAWNRNFETLLDLPRGFLATRPTLSDYFRYLTERGEYAAARDQEIEIGRMLERPDAEMRFERSRPDGHIIEVRRNPVPGGGFVLMYGDITERKRAEAEIRAARDAAERALLELRATQQQLVVQQKMAALGQLTAGIAHEIKNPLNFISNFASLSNELLLELQAAAAPAWAALDGDARAGIAEVIGLLSGNLDKIVEHGRRADNIVKSMLEHSRGVSGEHRLVDLNALIDEALRLAYHGARARDQSFEITLERDFAEPIAVIALVPQDITRVFLNLFGNGFYAANQRRQQASGGFRPVLKVATRDLGDAVEVRIRDNGTGIPPAVRDRLFQPFFTTKPTGEGTGLGLSISWDIVTQQHGGAITVDSEEGAFTEFTIRLPRVSP